MTTIYPSPPPAPAAVDQLTDLSDAIDLVGSGSYLVTRPGATTTVDGVVVAGTPGYFWAPGSMQPTSGRDIQRLPEGLRNRESKVFYTPEIINGAADGSTVPPDLITVDGALFEAQGLADWQQLGGYHRVVLVKVQS